MNKAALNFGKPLPSDSRQNLILAIRQYNGELLGFYPIAATTFTGVETTVTLPEGDISITTVTPLYSISDGSGYGVRGYMAHVVDEVEYRSNDYQSASFVLSNADGAFSKSTHSMPATGAVINAYRGVLATSLLVGMDASSAAPAPAPVGATASNATLNWSAGLVATSLAAECAFFDFNWVTLFQAKTGATAVRLEVVSNPASGAFKSSLVAIPTATPDGSSVQFNTVRVIRIGDATLGNHVFTYKVYDDKGTSTTCTLTLTVT